MGLLRTTTLRPAFTGGQDSRPPMLNWATRIPASKQNSGKDDCDTVTY